MAKILIIIGVIIVIVGLVLYFFDRIPFVGKLPGDILIRKKNYTFYFPLMTSIIISIILSLILYIISRFR